MNIEPESLNSKANIEQINAWWKLAQGEWSDWRERARKSYKFYFGDQWDATALQKLRMEGKPALTINKIKPIARTLSGYMRQNRRDLKVMPRRGGVQAVASIYTELLKYVFDISYADWYNALMFTDGVIGGKGFISIDRDFTRDPITGDIVIMREDPFLVLEDPFSQKYDLSDGRFVFRCRWLEKAQINTMFPNVQDLALNLGNENAESIKSAYETDDYTDTEKKSAMEISKSRYLVKECWYKTWKSKKYLVSQGTEVQDVSKEDTDTLNRILVQRPDLKMVERVMPELRMAIVLGNTILHEELDPYNGSIYFPVIRFADELIYAEKPMVRGEVEDIIMAQEEHNKRKSQMLHILNSTANSGYTVEKSALAPAELSKLESMGSRSGIVVVVEDGRLGSIRKETPPQLSTGHAELSDRADADMKAISGVNADLLGADKTQANSGIAMEMRRRQGLINLEPVFDNFDFTQRTLGDTMLDIIRKTDVYTPEEIKAIVGGKVKTIDGQVVSEQEIVAYMKTRKGMYSVGMADIQSNPTIRAANFREMLVAIKEAQIPVPPEMIVEASDWEFKDQWAEWFKQQSINKAQQAPAPANGQSLPIPEGQMMPEPAQGQPQLPPEIMQALGV